MSKVIEKYRTGEPVLGTVAHMRSMAAAEALAYSGLDFLMFDMEHSALGTSEAAAYITAAAAGGIDAFVRVPDGQRGHILHMLDAGADGIVVPAVNTAEEVKEIIRHAKFTPVGERGYCMTRDDGWSFGDCNEGGLGAYMDRCNRNTLLIIQCETRECLENIEAVTALEGVDGILIGPYDLSISLGIPGEFTNPILEEAVARIQAACKANKKMVLGFGGTPDLAAKYIRDGFDGALFGIDLLLLLNTYREKVSYIRENMK